MAHGVIWRLIGHYLWTKFTSCDWIRNHCDKNSLYWSHILPEEIYFLCREREAERVCSVGPSPLPRLESVILLLSWTRSSVFQMPPEPTKTYASDSKVVGTSSSLSMLSVLFHVIIHKEYSICMAHWTGKAPVSQKTQAQGLQMP